MEALSNVQFMVMGSCVVVVVVVVVDNIKQGCCLACFHVVQA